MPFFVYILTNKSYTLYVGSTQDLKQRLSQHNRASKANFTGKYKINRLIYYTECQTREEAVKLERKIKGWNRKKKIDLIKSFNPSFKELN